jgi:PAS domain S-box-containing protein
VLTAWSLDAAMKPTLVTPEKGTAYEDRFPDGTPRLLFVQPAEGTNWLAVIELPVISVLQLAMQISTPLLIILVVIGLVAGVGLAFLTRAITGPVYDLSRAAEQIAQGDLDRPVTISGEDEVGRLGSAFEQMRLSLKDRVDDLSLLLRVSQTVSASLDLEQGVPPLLAGAMQSTPARVARLVLLSETGMPEQVLSNEEGAQTLTPLDRALAALVAPSEKPILIDNVTRARSRAMLDLNLIGPGIKAIAALPVRRQARPMGVMWLGFADPHSFSESEVNVLGTLAGQAAVLIENARLFYVAEGGRRRLQAVLTSTSDAVIVTDKDNRVLLCNPAAEVAFHLKKDASSGQPIGEVWPDAAMLRLFDPAGSVTTRTEEIVLPDGRTLYGSASAIISGDSQTIGRVAVLRDITHLKELDAMKSEFVATVSHDLRAPLTYMRGYATMLPMVGSLTPKQQDYIEKVMAGIEQMTELIDDLLDLGRIEAGVGMVRETCVLADIARTVIESMSGQALSHGLTLSIGRLSERSIQGDQGLLRHAITNLVDNAIKYTSSGGSITVSVEEHESAMVVSVKDTGIGIAPADQVRLFERFYRVKRRETIDIKGTGLGLAIVKSIAEWHRGRVWVESQLGDGATFYILVPFKSDST